MQSTTSEKRGDQRSPQSSPVDNVTFDVITVLQQKCEALEAYEDYVDDAEGRPEVRSLLEEVRDNDRKDVERLRDCLAGLLGQGGEADGDASEDDTDEEGEDDEEVESTG